MASLDPAGDPQPLAFAVWQGAGGERDGHKNASTGWIFLDLSPLTVAESCRGEARTGRARLRASDTPAPSASSRTPAHSTSRPTTGA